MNNFFYTHVPDSCLFRCCNLHLFFHQSLLPQQPVFVKEDFRVEWPAEGRLGELAHQGALGREEASIWQHCGLHYSRRARTYVQYYTRKAYEIRLDQCVALILSKGGLLMSSNYLILSSPSLEQNWSPISLPSFSWDIRINSSGSNAQSQSSD